MEEEFLVCIVVSKPAERGPRKCMQDPMFPNQLPDGDVISCVVIQGVRDVKLESTGNEQI
jgi:hypothetical protein